MPENPLFSELTEIGTLYGNNFVNIKDYTLHVIKVAPHIQLLREKKRGFLLINVVRRGLRQSPRLMIRSAKWCH